MFDDPATGSKGWLETWYDFTSVHDGMVEYAFCHRSADSPELIYIARRGN